MKIQMLTGLFAVALFVAPALASIGSGQSTDQSGISSKSELLILSRRGRGADDPAGHVRGEGAGHASVTGPLELMQMARRGRGADDAPGHQRRCRGCDDGPNHT